MSFYSLINTIGLTNIKLLDFQRKQYVDVVFHKYKKRLGFGQSFNFERETDDDEPIRLSSFRYHDRMVMIVGNSITMQLFSLTYLQAEYFVSHCHISL